MDGNRVRYIRQTAEAISAVHAAGFIHRDICPRNLMLVDEGETADLKLIDFVKVRLDHAMRRAFGEKRHRVIDHAFGRPVASFQALKHRAAQCFIERSPVSCYLRGETSPTDGKLFLMRRVSSQH